MLHSVQSVPLKRSLRLRIACEIASGMDFLHSKQIIHRDLKTANILITESYHAKVTDFGVAHVVQNAGLEGLLSYAGTPGFMAPYAVT